MPQCTFDQTKLKLVVTSNYHICCQTGPATICSQKIPWHMSCLGFFPQKPVKVMLVIESILVLAANLISLCVHAVSATLAKSFRLSVYSISINELTYFVFLTMIFVAGMTHVQTSTIKLEMWLSHSICFCHKFSMFCLQHLGYLLFFSQLIQNSKKQALF